MEIITKIMFVAALVQGCLGNRHVVYWDQKQIPILTQGGLEISLEVDDYMDLLCPYSNGGDTHSRRNKLYLQLYNVTRDEYMLCDTKNGIRIQTCDDPEDEKKLTTKFQERSPYRYGFIFQPGSTYYYISKPLNDISRRCTQDTMKMVVHVKKQGTIFPIGSRKQTITYHNKDRNTDPDMIKDDKNDHLEPPHHRHHHNHHQKTTTKKPTTTSTPRPNIIIKFESPSLNRRTDPPVARPVQDTSTPGNGATRTFSTPSLLITILTVLAYKATVLH